MRRKGDQTPASVLLGGAVCLGSSDVLRQRFGSELNSALCQEKAWLNTKL